MDGWVDGLELLGMERARTAHTWHGRAPYPGMVIKGGKLWVARQG